MSDLLDDEIPDHVYMAILYGENPIAEEVAQVTSKEDEKTTLAKTEVARVTSKDDAGTSLRKTKSAPAVPRLCHSAKSESTWWLKRGVNPPDYSEPPKKKSRNLDISGVKTTSQCQTSKIAEIGKRAASQCQTRKIAEISKRTEARKTKNITVDEYPSVMLQPINQEPILLIHSPEQRNNPAPKIVETDIRPQSVIPMEITVEGILSEMQQMRRKLIPRIKSPERSNSPAPNVVETDIRPQSVVPMETTVEEIRSKILQPNNRKPIFPIPIHSTKQSTLEKPVGVDVEANIPVKPKKNRRGKNSKRNARKVMKIKKKLEKQLTSEYMNSLTQNIHF